MDWPLTTAFHVQIVIKVTVPKQFTTRFPSSIKFLSTDRCIVDAMRVVRMITTEDLKPFSIG